MGTGPDRIRHVSAETCAKLDLAVLAAVVIIGWQGALVATAGIGWGEYNLTIRAAFEAVFRGGHVAAVGTNTTGDLTGPLRVLVSIIGGYVLLRVVVWWLWRKHRIRQRNRAQGAGLSAAKDLRSRIKGPEKASLVVALFTLKKRPLSIRAEDTAAVIGVPRVGKSAFMVAPQVADAEGACITTSTRPDVLRLTQGIRRARGHVFVADFDGLSGWLNRLKWDVVAGCEDSEMADRRAKAMVNALAENENSRHMHFLDGCHKILRALLHAAALKEGGTMRDVLAWSQDFADESPADIIFARSSTVTLWKGELSQWCREDNPDTIGNTRTTLSRVLDSMTKESVLNQLCPDAGDPDAIDVGSFAYSTDTLYCLVNEAADASTAPIVTALVESITASVMTSTGRSRHGRLEPHLTLALDEAPNTCPLPSAPVLMTAGGGNGIHTWLYAQSYSQLVQRWGESGAKTIFFDGAAARVVFGGVGDTDFLHKVSDLLGDHLIERTSYSESTDGQGRTTGSQNTSQHWEAKMRVADIRKIPAGNVLLLYRELDAIVQVHPWWDRPDAAAFKASRVNSWKREGLPEAATSTDTSEDTPLGDASGGDDQRQVMT